MAVFELPKLKIAFFCVMIPKDVCEIFFAVRNVDCRNNWAEPPPEYKIPQSEAESWENERNSAFNDSVNKLLSASFEIFANSIKFFTPYYPFLWRTVATGRPTRNVSLFVAIDYCLHELIRLAIKYSLMKTTGIEFKATWLSGFAGLVARIISVHLAWVAFEMVGVRWIVGAAILFIVYDIMVIQPKSLPWNLLVDNAGNVRGTEEILQLANNQEFPVEKILLDRKSDTLPKTTYCNFIIKEHIVVAETMLDLLEPAQAQTLVAREICQWKMRLYYVDHACHILKNAVELFLCELAYEEPSFAGFFNLPSYIHPIIPFMLVFTVVRPVIESTANGLAGFFLGYRTFQCDGCACKVTNATQMLDALVKLAPVKSCQKFNGLYASWFYREPTLYQRITRIAKSY